MRTWYIYVTSASDDGLLEKIKVTGYLDTMMACVFDARARYPNANITVDERPGLRVYTA